MGLFNLYHTGRQYLHSQPRCLLFCLLGGACCDLACEGCITLSTRVCWQALVAFSSRVSITLLNLLKLGKQKSLLALCKEGLCDAELHRLIAGCNAVWPRPVESLRWPIPDTHDLKLKADNNGVVCRLRI